MDKLQLYITTSQAEFQTRVEINPDPYVQSWVCDLREAVSQVDYPIAGLSIFYLVKYIDTGMFVVVLRTIPKSPGSHLAAWIYIPYSLRIPDKDVLNFVQFITHKVEASEVSAKDIADMREVFSHDYEEEVLYPVFAPSEGLAYAYRYYGPRTGASLADLLGPYRYQPCYLTFAGVMLIDQDITTNVAGTNLTSAPLEDMAVLLPPHKNEVDGYRPTIYGQKFDLPYFVPMSRNIDIVWVKDNAADIKQAIYVAQGEMRAPNLNPSRPAPIPVRESKPAPKPEPVAKNEPFSASDSAENNSESEPTPRVEATQERQPSQERQIGQERKKTYHFQIPAKSAAIGTVIEFEITTNADLADSPIDGYEATSDIQEGAGRSNHLFYKASSSLKQQWLERSLFALGGAVIGALIMLACLGTGGSKSNDKPTIAAAETVVEVPVAVPSDTATQAQTQDASQATAQAQAPLDPADRSLEAAVRYLDTNQIWEKAEMESYPDLQGLYNDMNQIDRHKLVETWAPRLKDSRTFTNVARHARLSYKKKARKTPFNTPEETSIRIQAYLNNIDP